MRTAIIIAIPHDEKEKPVLLSGPDVPIVKQFEQFKEFKRLDTHEKYSSVELWTSDEGREGQRFLMTPKEAAAKAEAKKKALEAAAKASESKKAPAAQDTKNVVVKNTVETKTETKTK